MPRVFAIPEMTEHGGFMPCATIRLLLPLTKAPVASSIEVKFGSINDLEFQAANIVIAHRNSVSSIDELGKIKRYCLLNNAAFVYDLDDDLLALGSDHNQFAGFDSTKPVVRHALMSAHQIWVSTQTLANRYRQFGRNITVVPNTLDRRVWRPVNNSSPPGQPVQFLYMGTPTHQHDFVKLILPAFTRLRGELGDEVVLTLIGVTDQRPPDAIYSSIDVPPNIASTYAAFANWLQSLGPFDIGLAPLLPTPFNRAKSNIKQLEYSALGLATIAVDLEPYRTTPLRETTVLAKPTPAAFYRAMRRLALDANARRKLQAAASIAAHENIRSNEAEEPRLDLLQNLVHHGDRSSAAGFAVLSEVSEVCRSYEFLPPVHPGPIPQVARCFAFYFSDGPSPKHEQVNIKKSHAAERKLAKQYGFEGFCYCADGLTDERQKNLMNDIISDGDQFAFCLCWTGARQLEGNSAGSSPSVRDGTKWLAAQFLEQVVPILKNQNYLRIDGRAVLVVYQPGSLKNIGGIAKLWRKCAWEEGLGEILLVNSHGFNTDPSLIGFDANLHHAPYADGHMAESSARPTAEAVMSRNLLKNSYRSKRPKYPAFETVWAPPPKSPDDVSSARSGSPAAYQEFLENTCKSARARHSVGAPLVFLSGWNTPAPYASLQPDPVYGHAYLNATAKALQTVGTTERAQQLAVIAHVYYDEVWPELAKHLRRWDAPFRLYASVPDDRAKSIGKLIRADFPKAHVCSAPNRGRDIAPFLQLAQVAIDAGADLICKVHTKKSTHRADGIKWRQDLYQKVLGDKTWPKRIVEAFARNAALGIIGPEGHLVHAQFYWGANRPMVQALARAIGYPCDPEPMVFAAGSMFWVRSHALTPILNLAISAEDFEAESGQTDGTLAHAIERFFTIAAKMGGYRVADTRLVQNQEFSATLLRSDLELAAFRASEQRYPFAPSTHSA